MTNQNSAAQAGSRNDIARRLRDQAGQYEQDPRYMVDAALNRAAADEIERLRAERKLRAPVAEPAIVGWRDPDCGRMAQKGPPHGYNRYSEALMTVADHHALMAAALASAPVAVPPAPAARTEQATGHDRLLRALATQEAKDGIGALDALYDLAVKHGASKTAAAGFAHVANGAFAALEGQVHDEIRRRSLVAQAIAPVAGEAVAWKIYDAALGKHILTENPKVADMLLREGGNTVRSLVYGDAAPQANAKDVHNAALEKAARLMEQTGKRIAASDIRALKTQADRDGEACAKGDGNV